MPRAERAYLGFHFRVFQEDGQWVSECVELDVASCGATLDGAVAAILDATVVHLAALEESGQLARVIRERRIAVTPAASDQAPIELEGRLPVSLLGR